MGGESKQTNTQQSQTQPWEAAQPALKGILDQLNTLIPNSGLSQTSQSAINQLQQNAQAGNPYAAQIGNLATNLLNGGDATGQSGDVNQAYQDYVARLASTANGDNLDPTKIPGMGSWLDTIRDDVTNSVNGQFAAAGRDFSGANVQALARGVAQGVAPVITGQYNQNVANQKAAADAIYNAGNTNAGLQAGFQQQALANQQQGVQTANDALAAQNYTPQQLLQLEQLKQQLPAQTLALLAQIGVPIAGLGQQSNGTSETTSQMSGAEQFGKIATGINNLVNPLKFLFG
ncbi:tail fiber domain-containing protein [Bradyrhizobium sp. SYSU BS000235]|uniref:tail fiber domain-containing protein n=1 Tax=Bradyrhizobium sp. SYSU BS000235 TaxID=3411332 RepID=UPI003C71999A